ncbi:MAG TPA: hypothetical protein VEB69_12055 [Acidimicrobiia bacterium]|nr:hypothetical protein [Acidimicrobiia bacterium]
MTAPREPRWKEWRGYVGGLVMFAAEALIVIGLAVIAWLYSIVVLAFF